MVTIVDFPAGLAFEPFYPARADNAVSGGRSLFGAEQLIEGGAGYWTAQTRVVLRGRRDMATWNGVLAALGGRAGVLRMPLCRHAQRTLAYEGAGIADIAVPELGLPFSTGVLFSHGVGFRVRRMEIVTTVKASFGSRVLTVETAGAQLLPGFYITVLDALYRIAQVDVQDDGTSLVTVEGYLHDTVGIGAFIDAEFPTGLFRLADGTDAQVPMGAGHFKDIDLQLVEAQPTEADLVAA